MPLLPQSFRMYLSDIPATQSLVPVPDATAGLGYDSTTRAYLDRMGRMTSASQTPRNLYDSVQSSGRVLERLVNGPGDNSTGLSQAARSAKAQSFGKNLRGSISKGIGRTGMLGLGAAAVYGLGVGANGLGVNLADYLFDSKAPTIGVERKYLDLPSESRGLPESSQSTSVLNENQLRQRFMPSMFRDDPAGSTVPAGISEGTRTRALQTGTEDMSRGWLGSLSGSDRGLGSGGSRQLLF